MGDEGIGALFKLDLANGKHFFNDAIEINPLFVDPILELAELF